MYLCISSLSEANTLQEEPSPNTTQDIDKIESAQRRAARWATRDYQQASSVTEMLGKLRWRPLDQRRIDNRLIMLYKITYDLVAIPVAEYLVPNRWESKFIHPLAYRQIRTSTYYYKFSFFPRTTVHWNALPTSIGMLPTLAQFSHAVCRVVHVSPLLPDSILSFNYTFYLLTILTCCAIITYQAGMVMAQHSFRTVQTHFTYFTYLFIQLTPFSTWYTGIPFRFPLMRFGSIGRKKEFLRNMHVKSKRCQEIGTGSRALVPAFIPSTLLYLDLKLVSCYHALAM